MSPNETLAALQQQLEDERAKIKACEEEIAGMTPPRDPLVYDREERKRLASCKCVALLVSKIKSERERIERDATLTKSEDG